MFGRYIARTKFYNTKFFSNMLKSWSRPNKDSFVKKIFFFLILSMVYTPPF